MKKTLFIVTAAIAILGVAAYSFLTPKGEINMTKAKASESVSALELFAAFAADESSSNEKFSGKILSVSGRLNKVDKAEKGGFQLWLESGTDEGQVVCNMSKLDSLALSKLHIGQELSVKGTCTGYLFDVVLDNVIIENKK